MTKSLLALDVATVTGFAFGEIGQVPKADSIRFGSKNATDDECWGAATRWLVDFLKVFTPDVVALEAPIMSSSAAGGTNPHTQMRLLGLQAVLRNVVALRLPRPAKLVHVQSARKLFIGHGNLRGEEAKKRVKQRCIELGWLTPEGATYDKADALCVFAKAAADLDKDFAANFTPLMTSPANIYRLRPDVELEF